MSSVTQSGSFTLGDREVWRLGYGAMQLAGPGVFGPPKDPEMAVKVLQAALEAGVNHIDTSDFYGPHVTNQIIKKALHPYPESLTIVTKVSARRDEQGNWLPALSAPELTQAVEDNLRNLGLEALDVVNLRSMISVHGPAEGSLEEPLSTLIDLKKQGKIRHIGLSNVTAKQVEDGMKQTEIVCVQNFYNVANRHDDALIDALAAKHIPYVPFFPLGGFSPLQSQELNEIAASLNATPMQVALAWLLQRAPNILLIPGTSSLGHLNENLAAAHLTLPQAALDVLNNLPQTAQH
ncbi:aldo/keto reductase family oxidoreductase [Scandinavium sp.]|uniref:aldo/keto reductase family oxidoreductase n=1 Tax=Scandinavium sp. TaxID=2830653 RepID=UPI00289F4EB3|nr:aldo/keto reductase family oxidoreductase [Scandinavium sp.]